ncbi:cytochrome oxidase assembly protein 1 [Coemansia sp. RSA 552]|nr:cytochrome oxidase assembly protein 1 [Coemansia sp. RSA 552]
MSAPLRSSALRLACLTRQRLAAAPVVSFRSYSAQGVAPPAPEKPQEQTWQSANAKNPAFAVKRDLPQPKSRKREIGLFVAFAAVTWGLGTVIAFNYQRMTSTPVTAALFTARHNEEVCRVFGKQLNFTSAFPWISGDISHLKGFVDVEFDVTGDTGVVGHLVLRSRRAGKQNGDWHTVDFYVSTPDGRRIDCK